MMHILFFILSLAVGGYVATIVPFRWLGRLVLGGVAGLLAYYLLNLFAGWILGLTTQIPLIGPKIAEWAQQPAPAITMPALPKVPAGPAATAPAAPSAVPATTPRPGEKIAEPEVTDRIVVAVYDNARSGAMVGGRIYVEEFAPGVEKPLRQADELVDPQWGATLKTVKRGASYRIVFYRENPSRPLAEKVVYFSGGVKALVEKDGIWVTSNALVTQIVASEAGGETDGQ